MGEERPILEYATPQRKRTNWRFVRLCIANGLAVVTLLNELRLQRWWEFRQFAFFPLALAITVLLVGLASFRAVLSAKPQGPSRFHKAILITGLMIAISGFVGFAQCPHAVYLQVGPITIVMSGTACGNERRFQPILWEGVHFLWRHLG